jgi:hypothetical protein
MAMLHHTFFNLFAQAYGVGTYNNSVYSSGNSGSSLSNTGIAIATIVTIAALTLLTALVVRIMRRPVKQQVVETDDTQR